MTHWPDMQWAWRGPLAPGYDWRKSAGKALRSLFLQLAVVAGMAVAGYLADPAAVEKLLVAAPWAVYAVPLIVAGAEAARNWLKHRKD